MFVGYIKPYMVKVVQSYILPMRYFCFCVSLMPLTHIPNIKGSRTTAQKDYSLDFYHLAKKHQTMGGFQISLDELFEQLGLPDSYQDLSNLKNV